MWDYTEKVMEHFRNPRNVGEIPDATVVADVGNITCGDALRLYLKIENERIKDVKFKTFGCASAIASSSVLTEMIKGKTIAEAATVTDDDIASQLGGLPEAKMHCSVMGREALEKAISLYRGKAKPPLEEGKIICKCFGVTDNKIREMIRRHDLKTVEEVTHYTKAGGGCGKCKPEIEQIIAEVRAEMAKQAVKPAGPMTNLQRIQKIMEVIEREIRPSLRLDGGDIEVIDIDGLRVKVGFRGKCVGCHASSVTLRDVVEKRLREMVDPAVTVEEVH